MLSAIDRHRQYLAGDFNLTDSIEEYLSTIENKASLNAFIEVYAEEARVRARELDQKRDAGENLGKLAGVIVAVKDNICIKDKRVTCASRMLENYISPFHATVIEKILKEDGLIIGKTNLDEFAMGSSTENTYFGVAHNPHQSEHVAGGSSGGSAIA
ncbi:MAG: Asp-tRNA(Asn)/Glu-tRNA(Gln) amidotransferase GatCAB subunit A, partial [Calditrichaeota bacterium]